MQASFDLFDSRTSPPKERQASGRLSTRPTSVTAGETTTSTV